MKTTVISILLMLSVIKTCNNESNEYLIWNSRRKLTYSDFKGTSSSDSFYGAEIVVKLKLNFRIENTLKSFNVICVFDKNESWLKTKTPDILEHEQGHFDIGEIYARKFRVQLNKVKNQKMEISYQALDSMYKKINNDLLIRQNEYDEKTNHFLNVTQQEIWIKAIKEELSNLENEP